MSMNADGIVLSPGPKTPNEAGVCLDMVAACADVGKPLLGICLGHQAIGQYFGGEVRRGGLMHGKVSQINHGGGGIFAALPSPFAAVRYHSLVVGSVPDTLMVTATSDDGFVMGLQHRQHPIFGVQFHPESIATNYGLDILANFLRYTGTVRCGRRASSSGPTTVETSQPSPRSVRPRYKGHRTVNCA